ncbi:MAG TPA: hypothetical protein PLD36_05495, partial [Bacteroidia bacterium]|nr:hypothetical protein [Bacteroidia bacterium]
MKKVTFMLIASAMYISSCSTNRISARDYDDVYFSNKDATADNYRRDEGSGSQPAAQPEQYSSNQDNQENRAAEQNNSDNSYQNSDNSNNSSNERFSDQNNGDTEQYSDGKGNTYVTNNYYDDDDYYDYAYSARLRRFHHPYGWNYYD